MMNKQSFLCKNPIFIVGAPRSGTTLLQYMLRSHPNLSFPTGESHFFIPLYENHKSFGDLGKKENVHCVLEYMEKRNPEFVNTDFHGIDFNVDRISEELWSCGCDTIPRIIDGLYFLNAKSEGKTRWGEKTPYYVLHMKAIKEMFPDARFIHVIRDGRDAALSMIKRKKDLKVFNVFHAAYVWELYVRTGCRTGAELDEASYHQFRYEDLLSDPETVMERLFVFLNEPFDHSVIQYAPATDPDGKTPLLKGPLDKRSIGKWKNRMTSRQIRVFESVAGDTLKDFGYVLNTRAQSLSYPESVLYRAHIKASRLWLKMAADRPKNT